MNDRERDLFRLGHILECCDKITQLVSILKEYEYFERRWIEQDAMIRNFEIVGEASNHISIQTKERYAEIVWHRIRGMRNFMTHEYFGIRLLTIWDTAVYDIPKLKSQIENILSDLRTEEEQ